MKEQQEKIRVLDPHIILILFISAFVFGIGMLMIFLERKEIRTEGYEFIIFSVEILMLLLILYYMRTVVLSREGCTVSWLFWKRNYKWEELAVIRDGFGEYAALVTTVIVGIILLLWLASLVRNGRTGCGSADAGTGRGEELP